MKRPNPILMEVTRGEQVESEHRGRAVMMRSTGERLWSVGDVDDMTYPRSAIKAFQALPMVASGAAEHFDFTEAELALTCASHNGETEHIKTVEGMLAKVNATEADLECGHHWPMAEQATVALAWEHQTPDARHNNCSGKHAGMLALARQNGWDTQGYVEPGHKVQQAIRECIERCCETSLEQAPLSPDGCTAPTWAMPLHRLALGFARFGDPDQLPQEYRSAAQRLYQAAVREPFFVAGSQRYCSEVMQALEGRVFLKVGAEGVYIAAIPEFRVGIAVKIDSGFAEAAEVALSEILHRLGLPLARRWREPEIRNRNGIITGVNRPHTNSFETLLALH